MKEEKFFGVFFLVDLIIRLTPDPSSLLKFWKKKKSPDMVLIFPFLLSNGHSIFLLQNLKIHEMFIKQLVQLKGLSAEKAVAITQKYPTPRDLMTAFKKSENPEMLLSNLSYGLTNRNIGPTISRTIFKLYSNERFE